jgi:Ca-activated chloride channel family protein
MPLHAQLDVDFVAVETEDQISAILEMSVPLREVYESQRPVTHVVVVDRSGSMGDGRLEIVKEGLEFFVDQLDPQGNFGLVTFDGNVEVLVPGGPVRDKDELRHAIRGLQTGSMTNLSGGLMRGIQEARRVMGGSGASVTVLSDGLANVGVTAVGDLERITSSARKAGVTVATVRIGSGCDEELMTVVARGGGGNARGAYDADTLAVALASQLDGLLEQAVQAASLTVRPTAVVDAIHVFDDLRVSPIAGGFMLELDDLCAGERQRLLLSIDVPDMAGVGLAQVCNLELQWVDVATLGTHTVSMPVYANLIPGDQAAGRVARPSLHTEPVIEEHPALTGEVAEETCLLFDLAARAGAADAPAGSGLSEADRLFLEERRRRRSGRRLDGEG